MKSLISRAFLLTLPVLAGCVIDAATVRGFEERQQEQARLLAEQNALIEEQTSLLAQSVEAQQRMAEIVADLDRTLRDLERELDATDAAPAPDRKAGPAPKPAPSHGKTVLGRNEWAWLELLDRNLKARVDTGALSSSLNAIELQPFERDGRDWIRFRVPDEDHPDGGEVYETPLVRYVRIRQASVEELDRRPVVELKVRVGDLVDETEFTLTNREDMLYPLLLGRNFLRDVAVVDVARKFLHDKHKPEEMPLPVAPARAQEAAR